VLAYGLGEAINRDEVIDPLALKMSTLQGTTYLCSYVEEITTSRMFCGSSEQLLGISDPDYRRRKR